MKREDVEALLTLANLAGPRRRECAVPSDSLAALCRRWLAVEDAHRTYVSAVYDTCAVEDRGEVLATLPKSLVGVVRIVPEQGEGDRG